ncbi:MAG: hypothetical protein ACJ76X_04380 [Solirubrobacteraceae bacterium]|jgi:hypothetical protein
MSSRSEVFSADALDANQNGRLSADQLRALETGIKSKHSGLTGLVGRAFDPLVKDAKAGRVERVEGAGRKRQTSTAGSAASGGYDTHRYLRIANREAGDQQFGCPKDIFEFAPDTGMMRLFYLPASRLVINLELLPSQIENPQDTAQVLADYRASRSAHDKLGTAEALAQIGDAQRELDRAVPTEQTSGAPSDPGAFTEALVGTWESPLLTLSLGQDGTFTAHLADGSEHQGHWTVDADGRLNADMMGSPMVADASIDGDQLTLTLDDQALNFRRTTK